MDHKLQIAENNDEWQDAVEENQVIVNERAEQLIETQRQLLKTRMKQIVLLNEKIYTSLDKMPDGEAKSELQGLHSEFLGKIYRFKNDNNGFITFSATRPQNEGTSWSVDLMQQGEEIEALGDRILYDYRLSQEKTTFTNRYATPAPKTLTR